MVTKAIDLVVVDIQVDRNGNVTVSRNPNVPKLVSGQHEVQFTSNHPKTVIVFTETSPFAAADLPVGKKLPLGRSGEGPFKVVNKGQQNHFDCGEIDAAGNFSKWGGGGNTPT